VQFQARWRQLHPGFEYRLWSDADNDAFVRSQYPELYGLRDIPRSTQSVGGAIAA
jgi:mannosyltransferase OCH1-like enzyme